MVSRVESSTTHYDEKLRAILKTSAKIFAEKGFHRTSIRDISRATKMSLAGLYYYFRTKEELLFLIQEQCFLTLLQRWEKASNGEPDARSRIRIFAENHLGFFLHNMYEMKVMAHEDESLTGEFQEKILVLKRRYVKVLTGLIGELQNQAGNSKIDARVAAFSLFGMMNWIYTWHHSKRDLPLADLIQQMLRIYFFGVLTADHVTEPWLAPSSAKAGKGAFSLWQNLP